MHGRQPARTRPANEPQEKRFRLIVARMAERDDLSVQALTRAIEEFVPCGACRILERSALASRTSRDIFRVDDDWKPELGGERRAESLICVRFETKLMIEMRDARDLEIAGRGQLAREMRERHGIGSARD